MPPIVLDLRASEDSRDVVHRAVQALAEARVVAFPTETVYTLAASALSEAGVARLLGARGLAPGSKPTLAIKSADEAFDYAPNLCGVGQRLARRCWPGPVVLFVDDNHPDGLLTQLSAPVREALAGDGVLGLRVPAHHALVDVMRLLAGPIVTLDAKPAGQGDAVSAQDVLEAAGDDVQLILDDGRCRYGQRASAVRVKNQRMEILEAGVVPEPTLRRLANPSVLFVCTGNTCRSPMAETMFRALLEAQAKRSPNDEIGMEVGSAGMSAMLGDGPSQGAVQAMAEMGLDLTAHESRPMTDQLARDADLILAMTRSHRQAILNRWPEVADRVKLVSRDGSDISDPVGGPIEQYRGCAAQIKTELEKWLPELQFDAE